MIKATQMKRLALVVSVGLVPAAALAERTEKTVTYDFQGKTFEARLIYDDAQQTKRPGVLMVPNWMGPTAAAADKAWRVAGDDYVVMVADMYGAEVRPTSTGEASEAASAVRADVGMMRERANRALEVFREQAGQVPLDTQRIAAIGFCFGGGVVLEQARSGTELAAAVSFHGNLDTPEPGDAGNIRTPLLVLHGADDPYVDQRAVSGFVSEMREAGVEDWQLHQFGGAVHSFTEPNAEVPGQAQYDEKAANRAFEMMEDLFAEVFRQ